MSFAADICKNAMVTDCLVLKDKKVFPRQWNARESLFEPRKHSGFQVRDLSLSLSVSLSCTHTNAIFTPAWLFDGQSFYVWDRGKDREITSQRVCVEGESGEGLQIEISSLSSSLALPFFSRTHACFVSRLSSQLEVIRWDFILSGLNWLCHGLGVGIRFWMGSQHKLTF